MKKVLLYSGGMDSWLMNALWHPDILLYVNLHSQYSKNEMQRLPSNCIVEDLDLSKWERNDKIIPLRNVYLVCIAAMYGEKILLGATAGDRVLDKTDTFAKKASDLLSYLWQEQHWTKPRKFMISVEYKNRTKVQLLKEYLQHGGSIEKAFYESFSCYFPKPDNESCWNCKPCARKFMAFKACGFDAGVMSLSQVEKFIDQSRKEEYADFLKLRQEMSQ